MASGERSSATPSWLQLSWIDYCITPRRLTSKGRVTGLKKRKKPVFSNRSQPRDKAVLSEIGNLWTNVDLNPPSVPHGGDAGITTPAPRHSACAVPSNSAGGNG